MSPKSCDSRDIALKSFFLGPKAENSEWVRYLFDSTLQRWFSWRRSRFPGDGEAISAKDQGNAEFVSRRKRFEQALLELNSRFEGEVPKFSPRYIGHMFSEISLPALLGHVVALLHNPNNISGESSRIGVQIEEEAIRALLLMVGFDPQLGIGHFTSGGTLANFEALYRARERCQPSGQDDLVLLCPANAHYSWRKGASVLGLGENALWNIELDAQGSLSISHLLQQLERARIASKQVAMVVSVAGSTELGSIDPVDEVAKVLNDWRQRHGSRIWHHVDAAYGGFLCSLRHSKGGCLSEKALRALNGISQADSVTLDPHKLGYVPYSSAAFLVRSREDYALKIVDAPYIDYEKTCDRGLFTLEGSRSAAGAVATWMTARCIGLDDEGYGRILGRTLRIRSKLGAQLHDSELNIRVAPAKDTNILCFTIARKGAPISEANSEALRVYNAFSARGQGPFFVSKTTLRWNAYGSYLDAFTRDWAAVRDTDELVLVRMCLMNPFFDSVEMRVDFTALFIQALRELTASASKRRDGEL